SAQLQGNHASSLAGQLAGLALSAQSPTSMQSMCRREEAKALNPRIILAKIFFTDQLHQVNTRLWLASICFVSYGTTSLSNHWALKKKSAIGKPHLFVA